MDNYPNLSATQLRTPERIAASPEETLMPLPAWAHSLTWVYPEGHRDNPARLTPGVSLVLGEKHVTAKGFSPLQVAFLMEITRFRDAKVLTNQTKKNGGGRWYVRISFAGYREDLTMVSRVFAGAAEYDQTKVNGIASDMRAENLRNDAAEKVGKDARQVVMRHAKRMVAEADVLISAES